MNNMQSDIIAMIDSGKITAQEAELLLKFAQEEELACNKEDLDTRLAHIEKTISLLPDFSKLEKLSELEKFSQLDNIKEECEELRDECEDIRDECECLRDEDGDCEDYDEPGRKISFPF